MIFFSDSHNTASNKLLKELIQEVQQAFGKSIDLTKRSALTDLLGQVGQGLAQFFQPHLEAAKNVSIISILYKLN